MSRYVLIPDSFKGTMSSETVCQIMAQAIRRFEPAADIVQIPVADGGEGSVDAFLTALGGEKRGERVTGPLGKTVDSFWGVLSGGETAVIEMAAAAGLPQVGNTPDAAGATTYGVGELIRCALKAGCSKIILGLGGSATTDGGCGMAAALGAVFRDEKDRAFVPVGGTLHKIRRIELEGLDPRLQKVEITAMCDIDNPLFGPEGAAYVFGPQKGADPACVEMLDQGLRHLSSVMGEQTGRDLENRPGAGAAGGLGYGVEAFLGAKLQMGIETVLETVRFDQVLQGADMVFSGEGKIDSQSVRGKVISGIAKHTKAAGVPFVAVVGDIGDGIEEAYRQGVSAVFSINRLAIPFAKAKPRAREDLRLTMENIIRFSRVLGSGRNA